MEQKKAKQAGTRRAYTADGERGQKMMSFRLDLENIEYLNTKPNKGRYINELIARERERDGGQ